MKLLYLENSIWDFDYIRYELLANIENIEVELFNQKNFHLLLEREDIIDNNIFVINHAYKFNEVIKVVEKIQPKIIFHLSDEKGNIPEWVELEKYTKVLFRQYNYNNYNYSNKTTYQIPLGYVTNYLGKRTSLIVERKKMTEREYNSSFIGAKKADRGQMNDVLNKHMLRTNIKFVGNNWNINDLSYSPKHMFDIYNNSIFVVNGRGNTNLDCYRIYEAIVAGAIPVIVGKQEEINTTFNYNNSIPPFIYGESWENVVVICNELLNNNEKLEEKQQELLFWWENQISIIKEKIKEVIL
jgi:hypothetical protein